jgi:hypothetical protein
VPAEDLSAEVQQDQPVIAAAFVHSDLLLEQKDLFACLEWLPIPDHQVYKDLLAILPSLSMITKQGNLNP